MTGGDGAAGSTGRPVLWQARNITKRYGGVVALENVDFACSVGTVHAIVGENGAGKSTLVKIMAGVVRPDSGETWLEDRQVVFNRPADATAAGIACVFQELSLLPHLSVADNIFITNPPRRHGMIDVAAQRREAEAVLTRLGWTDINPRQQIRDLSLSRRQIVEIAKMMARRPKILILDEATSALAAEDVGKVFELLLRLRDEGMTIIYISHRLNEADRLANIYSVFRNGRHVETFAKGARSHDEIVQLMIGRNVEKLFPVKTAHVASGPPALQVRNLNWPPRLVDLSLTVGYGEIVGLGGLDGQGQRELLLSLFGVLRQQRGSVEIDGKPTHIGSPARAKSSHHRMALIPEDRKTEGLILSMSVAENISLASLRDVITGAWIDRRKEADRVDAMVRRLQIKVADVAAPVGTLSGGNQQKVVLAKWLLTTPRIVLLNDPTRGIDIGTKQEIYQLLRNLADEGAAILFYSTDYDELIGCCDRVMILYEGRIARELTGNDITETNIVAASLNLHAAAPAATADA
jgi:ribose transport system ATP-binding protein